MHQNIHFGLYNSGRTDETRTSHLAHGNHTVILTTDVTLYSCIPHWLLSGAWLGAKADMGPSFSASWWQCLRPQETLCRYASLFHRSEMGSGGMPMPGQDWLHSDCPCWWSWANKASGSGILSGDHEVWRKSSPTHYHVNSLATMAIAGLFHCAIVQMCRVTYWSCSFAQWWIIRGIAVVVLNY